MLKIRCKTIIGTGLVCGVIAAGAAGLTVAYFTSSEQVINQFTLGTHDVDIAEPEWDPQDGDGINLYPGYTVYKNPTIRNVASDKNGPEPSYARMIISITDREGNYIEDQEALDLICSTIRYDDTYQGNFYEKGQGEKLIEGRIPGYSLSVLQDIPMVNPDFVLDQTRSVSNRLVYNYVGEEGDGILDIGEEATLFTNIVIPVDWTLSEMEKAGDFVLTVTHESIQSSGFENQASAFEALDGVMSVRSAEQTEE